MQAELAISIRPLRHVYFIAGDDISRFRDVVAFCCTQWGGVNNLIIPVSKHESSQAIFIPPLFAKIIHKRRPDVFVDAVTGQEEDDTIFKALSAFVDSMYFGKQVLSWEAFIQNDPTPHTLYVKEQDEPLFGFTQEHPYLSGGVSLTLPRLAVPFWERDEDLPLLEKGIVNAAFGRIWPDQEGLYKAKYSFHQWPAYVPGASLHAQLGMGTDPSPISITGKALQYISDPFVVASHLNIVIAQDVRDLCWFWDLRAEAFGHFPSSEHILLLSKRQLFDPAYFEPLVRLIKEWRAQPQSRYEGVEFTPQKESKLDAVFHHSDEEISEFIRSQNELLSLNIENALEEEQATDNSEVRSVVDATDLAEPGQPISYLEGYFLPEGHYVYEEFGEHRPTILQDLTQGKNYFLAPNVGPQIRGVGYAVNVGLQSACWEQFPCHPAIAHFIIPESAAEASLDTLPGGTLQLNYRTTSHLSSEPTRVSLQIPTTWEMYRAYFQHQGLDIFPSDKLSYVNGLLEMADGLEKAGFLRERLTHRILDLLADRSTEKLAREFLRRANLPQSPSGEDLEDLKLFILGNADTPAFRRNPRTFKSIFSVINEALPIAERPKREIYLSILTKLISMGAVQRGLNITCPNCGTTTWYGVGILDERIKCLGCLESFILPLTEDASAHEDLPLQYALNPLANRAMDQGVLPVINTLFTLRALHQTMSHVVPGMLVTKLSEKDHPVGDFDFIYIYKHEIYGGECKTGEILSAKDINMARLARSLGFRTFFFATIASFGEQSRKLIEDLQQEIEQSKDAAHPFDIFILDGPILFAEQPLPSGIPL